MAYKKYEKYKNSGVEWIGEIPEHWEVKKLKFITRIFYGDSLPIENREEGDINVFGSNGIIGTHNMPNTLSPAIIIGRKGSFGKVTFSERECFAIDTTYFIDRRATKTNLKWLFYLLQLLELDKNSQDTGVPGLSREYAYNLYAILPYSEEQTAIANFLDQKTTEIDSLIADKEKLIQLLQEKRQAIITEAVTKGLDPNVPMKDSGVEWIGKIPEHWEILKLKNILLINDGGAWGEESDDEEGTIVLRSTEIKIDGSWDLQEPARRKLSPEEKKRCLLKTGDLLVTKSSGGQHIGKTAIVSEDIERLKCAFSNFMQRLRVNRNTCPKFVYYFINSHVGRTQLQYLSTTTAGWSNITSQILNTIIIPYSGYDEQTAIANFLDQKTAEIDSLISDIQTQIAKLKEYRQSLIYEAVTGKIDVRDFTTNTEGVVLDAQNTN